MDFTRHAKTLLQTEMRGLPEHEWQHVELIARSKAIEYGEPRVYKYIVAAALLIHRGFWPQMAGKGW